MTSRDKIICDVAYKSDGVLGVFRALPLFSFLHLSFECKCSSLELSLSLIHLHIRTHIQVLPVYEFLNLALQHA